MPSYRLVIASFILTALPLVAAEAKRGSPASNAEAGSGSFPYPGVLNAGDDSEAVLRVQTLLDRARFSPGIIDGVFGVLTERALTEFQRSQSLDATGRLDEETWRRLNSDQEPTLRSYTVSEADVAGPFATIPEDMMERAELEQLGYESPLEALAEKFHAAPELLEKLNPGVAWEAGAEIDVPAVVSETKLQAVRRIEVVGEPSALYAYGEGGQIVGYYPISSGSERDPLPVGDWEIRGVARDPVFEYNPELFWDSDPDHSKATLPAGPNNPVGVVWIDLSKEHYGLHGTPSPEAVGRAQSHGCIRLTNWDAMELADAVGPGVAVKIVAQSEESAP